jgi:hypothetical protein
MEFLQPAFLFASAAAAVPVVLHLVFRRKTPRVDFPTVRFLRDIDVRLARRRRLQEILVLALRCGALALLALALARPLWKPAGAEPGPAGRVALAIVLDSTASTAAADGGTTRFERARRAALELLDGLRPGDQAALFLPGTPSPFPAALTDRIDALRAALEKAEPGAGAFPLTAAVARASKALEGSSAAHREIALLSDFQKKSFGGEAAPGGERPRLLVADAGGETANAFVESARALDPPVFAGAPAEIGVTVGLSGGDPVGLRVSLWVDGKKAGEAAAELKPGETQALGFPCRFEAPGLHLVEARLEPHGLPADDSWHVLVRAHDRIPVLVVDGDPSAIPYRDEAFYVLAALGPAGDPEGGAGAFFRAETVRATDFPAGPLDPYRVIVLANAGSPGPRAEEALRAFVSRGGGLIAFPGDRSRPEPEPAEPAEERLFPARVAALEGDAAGGSEPRTWAKTDESHEIFRPLRGESRLDFGGARFYRVARLAPAPGARVVAEHENGLPALVEKRFGAGRVLQFSSTCDVDWNTLPVRTVFLPLLYRCAYVLAGLSDEPEPVLPAGSPVSVPAGCVLEGPGAGAPGAEGGSFPLSRPGFYRILTAPPPGQTPEVRAVLACGTDRSESDFARMDPAEAARWWGEDRAAVSPSLEGFARFAESYRRGTELAGTLLLLAALCFAAESFLANGGRASPARSAGLRPAPGAGETPAAQ